MASAGPCSRSHPKAFAEGIVNIFPNRFAGVITFDEQSIKDLGIIRVALDSLSARLAIYYGSNKDFSELKEFAEKCKASNLDCDVYHKIKHDCDFHLKLVSISKNQFLIEMQQYLYLKIRLLQTIKYTESDPTYDDIYEHEHIISALFERDADKTIHAMKTHLAKFYHLEDTHDIALIGHDYTHLIKSLFKRCGFSNVYNFEPLRSCAHAQCGKVIDS